MIRVSHRYEPGTRAVVTDHADFACTNGRIITLLLISGFWKPTNCLQPRSFKGESLFVDHRDFTTRISDAGSVGPPLQSKASAAQYFPFNVIISSEPTPVIGVAAESTAAGHHQQKWNQKWNPKRTKRVAQILLSGSGKRSAHGTGNFVQHWDRISRNAVCVNDQSALIGEGFIRELRTYVMGGVVEGARS